MHNIVFREKAIQHLGKEVVLYTTDGPDFETYLKYGKIPGVYATVDLEPEKIQKQYSTNRGLLNLMVIRYMLTLTILGHMLNILCVIICYKNDNYYSFSI